MDIYTHTHIGEGAEIFQIQLGDVYLFYHSNLALCKHLLLEYLEGKFSKRQ